MPIVGRRLYHEATELILNTVGLKCLRQKLGNILVQKYDRNLFINIAGKNLPYYGRDGRHAFLWETHVNPNRLATIEKESRRLKAEPWVVFCYAIFDNMFKKDFSTIITLNDIFFGAKLISVENFRKHMQPRSPSWGAVELPRKKVLKLTLEPNDI